jgi:hypothetical protein
LTDEQRTVGARFLSQNIGPADSFVSLVHLGTAIAKGRSARLDPHCQEQRESNYAKNGGANHDLVHCDAITPGVSLVFLHQKKSPAEAGRRGAIERLKRR